MGSFISNVLAYLSSYQYWTATTSESDESEFEYSDRVNYKITPLADIIPECLTEIDKGLQKDIAHLIIGFLVAVDLTPYLSKQLTLDYLVEDLNIYDFSQAQCRKKYAQTRAFIIENLSFSGLFTLQSITSPIIQYILSINPCTVNK